MFSSLAIYNNETLPNSIQSFAKIGSKFACTLIKLSKNCLSLLKFCQSSKFSPNLVTLAVRLFVSLSHSDLPTRALTNFRTIADCNFYPNEIIVPFAVRKKKTEHKAVIIIIGIVVVGVVIIIRNGQDTS